MLSSADLERLLTLVFDIQFTSDKKRLCSHSPTVTHYRCQVKHETLRLLVLRLTSANFRSVAGRSRQIPLVVEPMNRLFRSHTSVDLRPQRPDNFTSATSTTFNPSFSVYRLFISPFKDDVSAEVRCLVGHCLEKQKGALTLLRFP